MKQIKYINIAIYIVLTGLLIFNAYQIAAIGFPCGTSDFSLRWQEVVCILNGYNPMEVDSIPPIGEISHSVGYMPWAYLLGDLFVGHFESMTAAAIYASCVFILLTVVTVTVLYDTLVRNYGKNKTMFFVIIMAFLSQWSLASSWRAGNYGFQCCCMAVLAVCLKEKKILSGILLAFSLVKPQIGGLVFITFFLLQEYAVVITAAVVSVLSCLIASLMTGEMPWTLLFELLEMYNIDMLVEYPAKNNGIFTFLRNFHIPNTVIMIMSMLAGILLCIWAVKKLSKLQKADRFLLFSPAALMAPIWFYYNPYDKGIMIVPIIVIIFRIYHADNLRFFDGVKYFLMFVNCVAGHLIWKRAFGKLLEFIGLNECLSQDMAGLAEGIIYIIILVVMVRESIQVDKCTDVPGNKCIDI